MLARMRRPSAKWLLLIPPLLFGLAYLDRVESVPAGDWRRASRAPVGLAPVPATTPEPIVQVYAARAVRWRGYFGVHTWVAVKPRNAAQYTVYEVNGWRLRRTGSAVSIDHRPPDSRWFGNRPDLLAERRGEGVDELIVRIEQAVDSYEHADTYRVWPGPNSNTFVAHVLRSAPELRADLPATAIGKDYLGPGFVARSPSGTGAQLNLFGVVGALVGVEEGVELNVLGLTFGIDPLDRSLKLPLAGRVGWPRSVPLSPAAP
jgi:hypothetical protein